jgi:capsular polysaccharide biosynthesis protein
LRGTQRLRPSELEEDDFVSAQPALDTPPAEQVSDGSPAEQVSDTPPAPHAPDNPPAEHASDSPPLQDASGAHSSRTQKPRVRTPMTSAARASSEMRRAAILAIAIVAVCSAVGAAAAYWHASRSPKQYQSTAVLLFGANQPLRALLGANDATVNSQDAASLAATNVQLASLPVIGQIAAKRLPHKMFGGAPPSVSVAEAGASTLVNVTATEPTPAQAALAANAYADAFISYLGDRQSTALADAIAGLQRGVRAQGQKGTNGSNQSQSTLAQLETLHAAGTLNVSVAQRAIPPTAASSPKPLRDTLLGLLIGLIIGVAAALLLYQSLSRRVMRRDAPRSSVATVEEPN